MKSDTIPAARATAPADPAPLRLCDYGGVTHPPAVVFDVDGAWCSDACQRYDRSSEVTVWRRWSR